MIYLFAVDFFFVSADSSDWGRIYLIERWKNTAHYEAWGITCWEWGRNRTKGLFAMKAEEFKYVFICDLLSVASKWTVYTGCYKFEA